VLKIAARDGRLLVTHDKSTMPNYFVCQPSLVSFLIDSQVLS
jgi:hypothetical protein